MPPIGSQATFDGAQPVAAAREQASWMALPLFVLGLCAVNLLLHWPGTLNNDSASQLRQAMSGQYIASCATSMGPGPSPKRSKCDQNQAITGGCQSVYWPLMA